MEAEPRQKPEIARLGSQRPKEMERGQRKNRGRKREKGRDRREEEGKTKTRRGT